MTGSPRRFKLVASGAHRPSVWNDHALEPDYWRNHFNGDLLPDDWTAPEHWIRGLSYSLSDCVSWTKPLLSERAVAVFQSLASDCAEFRFFANIKKKPYFALNVIATAPALTSQDLPPLFQLRGQVLSPVFCTEIIPKAVVESGLTGFCFRDPLRDEIRNLFLGNDTNIYPGVLA
jgi:hypothetical protein